MAHVPIAEATLTRTASTVLSVLVIPPKSGIKKATIATATATKTAKHATTVTSSTEQLGLPVMSAPANRTSRGTARTVHAQATTTLTVKVAMRVPVAQQTTLTTLHASALTLSQPGTDLNAMSA